MIVKPTQLHGKHIPYLVCYECGYGNERSFEGKECLLAMLRNLANTYGGKGKKDSRKLMLYAHNMTYDGPFLMKHILNLKMHEKDNTYVSMSGDFCDWPTRRWITLDIRDSCRLIPMALKEMPAALGFKKEEDRKISHDLQSCPEYRNNA